jgi:hypothetical protein
VAHFFVLKVLICLQVSKNSITFAVGKQKPAREQHGEASEHGEKYIMLKVLIYLHISFIILTFANVKQ